MSSPSLPQKRKPETSAAPAHNDRAPAGAIHKNECHLAGVLTRAPEVRYTSSGKTVANLTVATTYQKSTEYHRVVCWERLAEKAGELAIKGDFVKIVGRLATSSWLDKVTGAKKYRTDVVAFQFVIPGKEPVTVSTTGAEITDEDIPF